MSGTEGGPEEIARDIEAQRERLAETVDQLSAKLDVKAQARRALTTPDGRPRPEALAAAGAVLALAVALAVLVVRRRRT